MESFVVHIRHIAGLKNKIVDGLSRLEENFLQQNDLVPNDIKEENISCLLFTNFEFSKEDIPLKLTEGTAFQGVHTVSEAGVKQEIARFWTPAKMFTEVHGDRHLHLGVRRTWLKANKRFSGHKMRCDYIEEMVSRCAGCQKNRLRMVGYLKPMLRHLKVPNLRKRIDMDNLTVTPVD